MKTLFFFLSFLFLPFINFAQDTETFDFLLKLYSPEEFEETDFDLAYIEQGEVAELNSSSGNIYAIYSENNTDLSSSQGIGHIDEIESGNSPVAIEFNNSPDVSIIKKMGFGLMETSIIVPKKYYRSIFFYLIKNCIYLTDVFEENNFYSLDYILSNDSDELEKKILSELLAEIKFVAGAMREQMDSPPVTEGRFSGKDLFTAMENSTTDDVMSFLRYMKLRPRKYQGTTWKISEIYATWIDGGAPTTKSDLKELLLENLGNEAESKRLIADASPAALSDFSEEWRTEASQSIENEQFTESEVLLRIALFAAKHSGDDEAIGWSYFGQGELHNALNENEEAVSAFQKAREYFEKADLGIGEIAALNNEARAWMRMEKYESAFNPLYIAEKLCGHIFEKENGHAIAPVFALVKKNIGECHMELGKNDLALNSFQKGLEYVNDRNDKLSLKRKATLLMMISNVYEKTGKGHYKEKYEKEAVEAWHQMERADDN